MNNLVLKQKITSGIGPSELQVLAKEQAELIFQKIKAREKSISEAKKQAQDAANIETGFFKWGNTDKKVDATATALINTNKALSEVNELIQESIRLTCTSIQFAQVMNKTMAHLMAYGFKDANGNVQKLAGESEEFVRLILKEAEDFVCKQLAFEKQHGEILVRLSQKEQIDAAQTQRLEELDSLLTQKKTIDDAQEKAIQLLFDYTKQKDQLDKEQSDFIQGLVKQAQVGRLSLTLSILSLVATAGAITLLYLKLW